MSTPITCKHCGERLGGAGYTVTTLPLRAAIPQREEEPSLRCSLGNRRRARRRHGIAQCCACAEAQAARLDRHEARTIQECEADGHHFFWDGDCARCRWENQ